jgi:hypothetical protein
MNIYRNKFKRIFCLFKRRLAGKIKFRISENSKKKLMKIHGKFSLLMRIFFNKYLHPENRFLDLTFETQTRTRVSDLSL